MWNSKVSTQKPQKLSSLGELGEFYSWNCVDEMHSWKIMYKKILSIFFSSTFRDLVVQKKHFGLSSAKSLLGS